jgi:hypothetical protein
MKKAADKRMIRRAVLAMVLMLTAQPASAVITHSYTYDENRRPIESPYGYQIRSVYFGENLPSGRLSAPLDFYAGDDGRLYLLDSGNNRVVVLDEEFALLSVIDTFTLDGVPSPLVNPTGIFAYGPDEIYIADPMNNRAVCIDGDGTVLRQFTKPASELFPQEKSFAPTRILRDEGGNVYCIATGIFQGAVSYDSTGEFIGFYGANDVTVSVRMLMDKLYKRIFSKDNRDRFADYIPIEYTSFDIDRESFVYTCTAQISDNRLMLKKLNPLGQNILLPLVEESYQKGFGDLNVRTYTTEADYSRFIDISVDRRGNISALDFAKGRVFQYDPDGNLMFIFGGFGNRFGNFLNPTAIETIGDDILVLDSATNAINVFSPTRFGKPCLPRWNYTRMVDTWNRWRPGRMCSSTAPTSTSRISASEKRSSNSRNTVRPWTPSGSPDTPKGMMTHIDIIAPYAAGSCSIASLAYS